MQKKQTPVVSCALQSRGKDEAAPAVLQDGGGVPRSQSLSVPGVNGNENCEGSTTKAVRKASHIVVEDAGMRLSFVARKGVYYDKRRRLWRANWKENGRIHTKGFSVHGPTSITRHQHWNATFVVHLGHNSARIRLSFSANFMIRDRPSTALPCSVVTRLINEDPLVLYVHQWCLVTARVCGCGLASGRRLPQPPCGAAESHRVSGAERTGNRNLSPG